MKTCVCIATFKRHGGLQRLLDSMPAAIAGVTDVTIVVADNEPSPIVEAAVLAFGATHGIEVDYVPVAQPGIAAARNASVEAAAGADFFAFVDDDEVAPDGWLLGLLEAQSRLGSEVVTGGVKRVLDGDVPAWMVRGGAFDFFVPKLTDGATLKWCATNNTLVTRGCFESVDGGFSDAYGLTGGSDTHFFRRATLSGASIRWVSEIVVTEHVDASRVSAGWLLKRAYRSGTTIGRVERELRGLRGVASRGAAAGYNLLRGTVVLTKGAFRRDKAGVVAGLQWISFALGALAGILGLRVVEYKRP